jgi:hypothetical protein
MGWSSDKAMFFSEPNVNTDPSRRLLGVFDGPIANKVAFLVLFGEFWFILKFLRPIGGCERRRVLLRL